MITNSVKTSLSPILIQNSKVIALETSLQETLFNFKELLIHFEQLHIDSENYKAQFLKQTEKCESKTCAGVEELKKVIQKKNDIIQLTASTLTRLSESRNWSIIEELFTILLEDTGSILPQDNRKCTTVTQAVSTNKLLTPKKEVDSSIKDDSISEIEGTPTGRCSPIIQMKKHKSNLVMKVDRDKKKCPDSWPTSDNKQLKLKYPMTRNKKHNSSNTWRQSRLSVVKTKASNVIDISSSPEFSGGNRSSNIDNDNYIQPPIKKEIIENDDTILPSPTSGPTDFTLFKSPLKFKKPQLKLKSKSVASNKIFMKYDEDAENKIKIEKKDVQNEETTNIMNDVKTCHSITFTQDDSINLLHPDRLSKKSKISPLKQIETTENSLAKQTNMTTCCQTQSSESILNHLNHVYGEGNISPNKRPLAENLNTTNISDEKDLQASMLFPPHDGKHRLANDTAKRKIMQPFDTHQGSTPSTKAQKRQVPGWACEKCISFFAELHKDDPVLMLRKINECSHHRGVNNPERPKTPPGYWNPRWNVPDDTEEFNRRNNI